MRAGVHSEKFWPFTPWNGAAPVAASQPATDEQHPTGQDNSSAPEPETVVSVREGIMASDQFQQKVAPFCKDVKPEELENCKTHMGERLWCALFARNIQRFLTMPGKNEEREHCQSINAEASADWFMHSTWQLRGAFVQRKARVGKVSGSWWPFASSAVEPTPVPAEEPVHKPTAAPTAKWQPKQTVAMSRVHTIESKEFQQRLAPFCKDAPAEDLEKCKTYMGERLWCAMFVRNIQKFLTTEGKAEEKEKCDGINAMKGADFFTYATWQLRFLQKGQMQHWSPFRSTPVAHLQRSEPKTKAGEALDGDSPSLNDPNSFGSSADPAVAETRAGVMTTSEFKNRVAPFCKGVAAKDLEHCQGYAGKRMWCAVFARNIQQFLTAEGKDEEREKCAPVNAMEDADWFMHSSYQLHL